MVEERGMRIEEVEEKEEWGLWGMRREEEEERGVSGDEEGRGGMVEEDKDE